MREMQIRQSRQKLVEALLALMETEVFEDITVTDITQKAGVARLTFYRHFESKDQILLAYLDAIFESYLGELSKTAGMNLRGGLCRCFEYWKRDKRLPNLLSQHNVVPLIQRSFGNYLLRVLETNILARKLSYFQRKFVEGGLLEIMVDWISNPRGLSPEDMADMVLDLINLHADAI